MTIPKVNAEGQKELKKVEVQFDKTQESIKQASDKIIQFPPPKKEETPEVKKQEKEIYLKPVRTIGCRDKFNESFRSKMNYDKEYVRFIAENNEIKGEAIETWTRPWGGMSAELWLVPVNKPVWGPRHLAEQIARKHYHRFVMEDKPVSQEGNVTYYGAMQVQQIVHRLNAYPAREETTVSFHQKASNF